MKKFKYRLAPWLKFKKTERDQAVTELNKAEAYHKELQQRYSWMENEMRKSYQYNSNFGRSISNINYVNDNNNFIVLLKKQMQSLSSEIAMAEEEYEKRYQELVDVQVEIKKLESHQESEELKYKQKHKKLMEKQMDELNSHRKRGRDAKSV